MLIEFLILFQVLALITFAFGYKSMHMELFVISTILFAVVGFSYYNIEIVDSVPNEIDTETSLVTIAYEKVIIQSESIPLAWINFGAAIISFIAGIALAFVNPVTQWSDYNE